MDKDSGEQCDDGNDDVHDNCVCMYLTHSTKFVLFQNLCIKADSVFVFVFQLLLNLQSEIILL